jgi:hypothetical protein
MIHTSQEADYQIVVEGVLAPVWLDCLGNLKITEQRQSERTVVTRLKGRFTDQSALQGVLDTLFMLGLLLVLVERIEADKEATHASPGGQLSP